MSDQLLIGTAPTAPEGREMFFYCADSWLALCEAIDLLVEEGFPPNQSMSAEAASSLSAILTRARSSGQLGAALERVVSGLFDDDGDSARREASYVEHLLEQAEKFAIFLGACGGCYTD